MSTDGGMDKEDVGHIYNEILKWNLRWKSLHLSRLLQRHYFALCYGWIIIHCIYDNTSSLPIALLMDIQVASMSWPLWIELQWTLGCMYLLELWFPLDRCPGMGLLDHVAALVLVFKGTSISFSIVTVPVYIPSNSVGEFPFLHILSSIYCL